MNYLGIDWGEKRIGLALGDDEVRIVSPFKVVASLQEVLDVIKDEDIEMAVVGEPRSIFNFQFSISNEGFNGFVKELKERGGVPVALMDERLSSKAADALSGSKKEKGARDAVAAMIILQSYFDKK